MKKTFVGIYNPSIILTYFGVFSAVAGMGMVLLGGEMNRAMIFLVIAGICDMFDGAVARRFKRTEQEKQFGIQLDSLADTLSFVAFPAAILMKAVGVSIISVVVACFYAFAGIMRLGWFNVTTQENKGFYQGLPVTFSAMIFPACYLILRLLNVAYLKTVFPVLFACVALLFILNFKLKKPGIKALIVVAFVAVAVIVGLLLI